MIWPGSAALAAGMLFSATAALAAVPDMQSAARFYAHPASLNDRLRHNPFRRALSINSSESPTALKGEIHALIDYPFATVSASLDDAESWCDVLILHINTKYCHATAGAANTHLMVRIGRKTPQPLKDATPIEFTYRVTAATASFLEIRLIAPEGPLGTRNVRIELQAVPVGSGQTLLHLSYAYDYGMVGRLAMQGYLSTLGSGKVGFTQIAPNGGAPEYVGGMRGLVERNTMRYYLAIDAYLGSLAWPPSVQLQKRLQSWFSATEQYPRQLHEVNWTAYLEMKQGETLRQQTLQ